MFYRHARFYAIIFHAFHACHSSAVPVYTSKSDLVAALNTCLTTSPVGACTPAIGTWDVSAIIDMSNLFHTKTAFNTDISTWNVANVTNFFEMFRGAYAFNQPIGSWNVSTATNMMNMFVDAFAFNQPINSWNVANVISFDSFLHGRGGNMAFNQPLGSWTVERCPTFTFMFANCQSFNQDLSTWDVTSGTTFTSMFSGAAAFNQVLCSAPWRSKRELTTVDTFLGSNGSVCQDSITSPTPPQLPPLSPPPSPPPPPPSPPLTPGGAWVIRVRFTLRIT